MNIYLNIVLMIVTFIILLLVWKYYKPYENELQEHL
jgi:hypothetical protein